VFHNFRRRIILCRKCRDIAIVCLWGKLEIYLILRLGRIIPQEVEGATLGKRENKKSGSDSMMSILFCVITYLHESAACSLGEWGMAAIQRHGGWLMISIFSRVMKALGTCWCGIGGKVQSGQCGFLGKRN
jgi:hypothetical protein